MLLREAIAKVLEDGRLTYREIMDRINALRLYMPGDGTLMECNQGWQAALQHRPKQDSSSGEQSWAGPLKAE